MTNYLNKFSLKKKIAYIVGGLGLVGKEVAKAYAMASARTIILDIKKKEGLLFEKQMKREGYDFSYIFFDCSNTKKRLRQIHIEPRCPSQGHAGLHLHIGRNARHAEFQCS